MGAAGSRRVPLCVGRPAKPKPKPEGEGEGKGEEEVDPLTKVREEAVRRGEVLAVEAVPPPAPLPDTPARTEEEEEDDGNDIAELDTPDIVEPASARRGFVDPRIAHIPPPEKLMAQPEPPRKLPRLDALQPHLPFDVTRTGNRVDLWAPSEKYSVADLLDLQGDADVDDVHDPGRGTWFQATVVDCKMDVTPAASKGAPPIIDLASVWFYVEYIHNPYGREDLRRRQKERQLYLEAYGVECYSFYEFEYEWIHLATEGHRLAQLYTFTERPADEEEDQAAAPAQRGAARNSAPRAVPAPAPAHPATNTFERLFGDGSGDSGSGTDSSSGGRSRRPRRRRRSRPRRRERRRSGSKSGRGKKRKEVEEERFEVETGAVESVEQQRRVERERMERALERQRAKDERREARERKAAEAKESERRRREELLEQRRKELEEEAEAENRRREEEKAAAAAAAVSLAATKPKTLARLQEVYGDRMRTRDAAPAPPAEAGEVQAAADEESAREKKKKKKRKKERSKKRPKDKAAAADKTRAGKKKGDGARETAQRSPPRDEEKHAAEITDDAFFGQLELFGDLSVERVGQVGGSGLYRAFAHQIYGSEEHHREVARLCERELARRGARPNAFGEFEEEEALEALGAVFRRRVDLYDYDSMAGGAAEPLSLGPAGAERVRLTCHAHRLSGRGHLRLNARASGAAAAAAAPLRNVYHSVISPAGPPPLGDTYGPHDSIRLLEEAAAAL